MKNEKVFSSGGFYQVVLSSNALLHREAAQVGTEIVAKWLEGRSTSERVRVLDLACGSHPYTIAEIISQNRSYVFEYCGLDINKDQVADARINVVCERNIIAMKITEGDVWELKASGFNKPFDIIYSGLNLHHGTKEQLKRLFTQMMPILTERGIFLNHDFYRPQADTAASRSDSLDCDWRLAFIEEQGNYLRSYGAEEKGILENSAHIMKYDHPLRVYEVVELLENAGFSVRAHALYNKDHPLSKYLAVIEARIKGRL